MASILIVEPDPASRDRYRRELQEEGYRVITAGTGPEALRAVQEEVPDVLISEICLPGMDGLDLMNRVRATHAKLPVILYSRSARYRDDFQSWAADSYLVKSGDTSPLRSAVAALMRPAPSPPRPQASL